MSTGVTCTVYAAGQRLADGQLTDDPADPTVLSGLSFTWGRSTIVDQPEASSCSFQLLDDPGGVSFMDQLRTGIPIDVFATGTLYTDPDKSTVLDPGFEQPAIGELPGNVRATNAVATVQDAPDGRRALQAFPVDAASAEQILIAPAAFSTDVGAWDDIPAVSNSQTWKILVDVLTPPAATVQVQPVAFADATGTRVQNVGAAVSAAGTGTFTTLTVTVAPDMVGVWLGVRVRFFPTGPRWTQAGGTWAAAVGTWRQKATGYITNIRILAPAGGVERTVLAFSGRVSDLSLGYDEGKDAPVVQVTAVDFTADLDNVRVGDDPWPVQPMATRFARVLELAGLDIEAQIDDQLASYRFSYQDVDSQPATGLLKDFAQSVDGVMWSAVHTTTGPYVHVEDTTNRPALYQLSTGTDGYVVITPVTALDLGQGISACDVLRDPVTWEQSVSDVSTRVAVTWLEQGVDDEGRPETTERTHTVVDEALEASYGQRGVSLSTLLIAPEDAAAIAQRILTRTSVTGWRVTGLTIDDESIAITDTVAVSMILKLLDGTARNGLPIILEDLPAWSPITPPAPTYTPWEEQRRNIFPDPAFATVNYVALYGGSTRSVADGVATVTRTTDGTGLMAMLYPVPHTANAPFSARVQVRRKTGMATSRSVSLVPASYAGGSGIGWGTVGSGTRYVALTDQWQEVEFSRLVSGPTATRVGIQLNAQGAWLTGEGIEIRSVVMEEAPTPGAFFTGGTLDTTLARTRWLGTPNASASVFETRQQLPPNITLPVYLEGGTYSFEDGAWVLSLTVSRAEGQGRTASWSDLLDEWAWTDFPPEISWDDLVGTTVLEGGVTV